MTQTTRLEIMFELAKHTKQSSKSSYKSETFDLLEPKVLAIDYLGNISKEGEDGLKDFDSIEINYHYTEDDAIFHYANLVTRRGSAWLGYTYVRESITGTDLSEVYDIGQRGEFEGKEDIIYSTDVYACGGNDLIIGSSQGRAPVQVINAYGGPGIDHYASTELHGTIFNILDIEAGETFTTHQNYSQLELAFEYDTGVKQYKISRDDSNLAHVITVMPRLEILQLHDVNDNNVFICVPER